MEVLLTTLVLSALCQMPDLYWGGSSQSRDPEPFEFSPYGCVATVLVSPFAGIISPLAGLSVLFSVWANFNGVRKQRERALVKAASGRLVRDLHLGDEAVAAAVHRLDGLASDGIVAQHATHRRHVRGQHRFAHELAGPELIEELLLGDDAIAMARTRSSCTRRAVAVVIERPVRSMLVSTRAGPSIGGAV